MRGIRHIVRLLLVALLVCTFAPPLATAPMHGAADHVYATDDPGLLETQDAGDHAITDHVHEAVISGAATLAPRSLLRVGLGQEDLAPASRHRMERPPR